MIRIEKTRMVAFRLTEERKAGLHVALARERVRMQHVGEALVELLLEERDNGITREICERARRVREA